jgi:DNA polymerase-3 subunit delta'
MLEPVDLPRLDELAGQPQAIAALEALRASDDPVPPLLLHGPEGVGKRSAALAFVAALVCLQPQQGGPCRRCRACHRVGDAERVTAGRADARATDAPEAYPDIGLVSVPRRKTRISVLQARDVIVSMAAAPFELARRAYVIEPADRMTPAAANALLKLLEEPPRWAVLVLVTTAPWALPITVRSRLRRVPFRPLDRETLVRLLVDRGFDEDEARRRARRARGSVARALALDVEADRERATLWHEVLTALGRGGAPGALAVRAGEAVGGSGEEALEGFEVLLEILRDAGAVASGATGSLEVLGEDEARELAEALDALAGPALHRVPALDTLRREIVQFNRNPRLAVEGAVLTLGGLLDRRR